MPRLNVVDPQRAEGKARELFEGPLKGKHFNIFKGLANSPAALEAYLALSGALQNTQLTAKEREYIALATAEANDCRYCLAAHTALGKMAGLSDAEMLAARRGDGTDPRLTALGRFVRALHEKKGFVSDADLAAVRAAGYTDGHIAEITAVYALNVFTNLFNHVNDTAIDFPGAPPLK